MDEVVRELHRDLARKYQRHSSRIEQTWRSLGQSQREKVLRDGAKDGDILKDPYDTHLGIVYIMMPEWNLRDITPPSSEFLLDMLKHRATTPLTDQYMKGANGAPGDYEHIFNAVQKYGLQHLGGSSYKDCFTLFLGDENYGQSFKIAQGKRDEILADFKQVIEAELMISQSIGELVLKRQMFLLQHFNIVIEDILEAASTAPCQTTRPNRTIDVATAALANLSLHSPTMKPGIPDLIESSQEQKCSWEDYSSLIFTEPTVLAHEVNIWFFTRPELVADEKGRSIPVHTDRYISGAVLDAVHGAVKATAIWDYISRLLVLLDSSHDKQFRSFVLRELSNTCYLEYVRTRTLFKRSMSVYSGGNKWFKRSSAMRTDGIVRVSLKRDPESVMTGDPQLYYMLRLYPNGLQWSGCVQWLQKLEDLHRAHPLEKEKMTEPEFNALGDLAVIVTFLQSLSQVEQMPAVNQKKKEGSFLPLFLDLDTRIGQLKDGLDLGDFAIPIANLLEPGMASGALNALERRVHEKTGTKLISWYEHLVEDSVENMKRLYQESKVKASEIQTGILPTTMSDEPKAFFSQRKEKEKTRPAPSSIYAVSTEADVRPSLSAPPAPPQQRFNVKASTFQLFSMLLSRSSAARGSISWGAFVAAMTDVGFSVTPKVGSIYTFVPPGNMAVRRHCTFHRPHKSYIEGVVLLVYASRLKRVYKWDNTTFVSG